MIPSLLTPLRSFPSRALSKFRVPYALQGTKAFSVVLSGLARLHPPFFWLALFFNPSHTFI